MKLSHDDRFPLAQDQMMLEKHPSGPLTLFRHFKVLHRRQLVQNSAARILTGTNKRTRITLSVSALHWLPFKISN